MSDGMTIEEIIKTLSEKYGDEFNWFLLPADNTFFAKELKIELHSDDKFLSGEIRAVAKCESNDDVLFQGIVSNSCSWRIYHLTYAVDNALGYPKYIEFSDAQSVGEYIQEQLQQHSR